MKSTKKMIIKPGSVWLYKDYPWYKTMWSKLTRKELPYNKWYLFSDAEEFVLISKFPPTWDEDAILEPKRTYTAKEIVRMQTMYREGGLFNDADLLTLINVVRPNTVTIVDGLSALEGSKYYNHRYLNDESEWSQYTFNSK